VAPAPLTGDEQRPRDLAALAGLWPAVIDVVRGENALLGALIAEARPVALEGDDLAVAFPPTAQFLKKKAEDASNRAIVLEALRAVTGVRWRLSYVLSEELAGAGEPQPAASEEEWVRRFIEEFDAEEIDAPGEQGAVGAAGGGAHPGEGTG
jgi:hypothetical protein